MLQGYLGDNSMISDVVKYVKISCNVTDRVPVYSLEPFQKDLKSLSKENYEKLRKSILKHGITMPIHVWENDNKFFILDGHQRKFTLEAMEKEGFEIPLLPIVRVVAHSHKDANAVLLTMVSQYGKVDPDGLYHFMIDNEFDPGVIASDFDIRDIDLPSFNAEFFLDNVGSSEEESSSDKAIEEKEYSEKEEVATFQHECPRCGFEFD